MHLWPSTRIRDSFKIAYLKKLEWNLHRMNSEKRSEGSASSNQQSLLDENGSGKDIDTRSSITKSPCLGKAALICGEILMVLSCCYCCFCCGACVDEDED